MEPNFGSGFWKINICFTVKDKGQIKRFFHWTLYILGLNSNKKNKKIIRLKRKTIEIEIERKNELNLINTEQIPYEMCLFIKWEYVLYF